MSETTWSNGDFIEIAPRVWRAVCEPANVNVILVAGDEGALIVDTGSCHEQGVALREAAEALLDVPLTHALVTHAHFDHWYGLSAFADLHTIGHQSLAGVAEQSQAEADAKGPGVSVTVPKELVRMVTVVQLGNRFLEVVHPHDAHTPGDLYVTIADANLLLAGDLIESAGPPWAGEESDLEGWVKSIDMMLGSMRRDASVVPGHGDPVSGDIASWQREILNGILTQTKELASQGIGADKALDAASWPWEDRAAMQAAIDAGYRHWARQGVVPRINLGLKEKQS